jgi:hypothetical protein
MADPHPYAGTPRWVKLFGIISILVVLLFAVLHLIPGPHGRHMPSGETHRGTSLSGVSKSSVSQR